MRIGESELAARLRFAEQVTDGRAERHLGDVGERRGDTGDGPHPTDVGKRDQQRRLGLGPAQDAHQLGCSVRRRGSVARRDQQRGER